MNVNSIIDQLVYDSASGALTYRDVRYVVIRPETIIGFQKTIEKHSREGARDALFQGGYQGGYLSAKKFKETQNLSDTETIDFMMTMGAQIGWGHFDLIDYDFKNRKLQIRVLNSAFAEAYGDATEGVCHLINGVLSGLAAVLFGRNCMGSETECLAKGDPHCVFHIR
ncbi:MAG: 4-vinyl reductase [Desulfobacterales bacterium]|jgi:predicted hydrocarbon binding protein